MGTTLAVAESTIVISGKTIAKALSPIASLFELDHFASDLDKMVSNKNVSRGKSRAPETGNPGDIYEQVDNQGNVMSRTQYGENGRPIYRDDLLGRPHYDKKTGQYLAQHRHSFQYNSKGQPIGETVLPIPD